MNDVIKIVLLIVLSLTREVFRAFETDHARPMHPRPTTQRVDK